MLSTKVFKSPINPTWCARCGDYGILNAVKRALVELEIAPHQVLFFSGIGCGSKLPDYINANGFTTIHGRPIPIAQGAKLANHELTVIVVAGDGDTYGIGGNHFVHAVRRNPDITVIVQNNQVYGLTKGQYSPTSAVGKVTKSTPYGSLEWPINPASLALAAEATFVARTIATDTKHLYAMLVRAARHKGGSFLEVYQNCNIYNDGTFDQFADRAVRDERTICLEPGQPLVFGKNKDKAIKLDGTRPVICAADDPDVLVHNEASPDPASAYLLAHMEPPELPLPLGVIRAVDRPTYEDGVAAQARQARQKQGEGDITALLNGGDTWTVV